MKIRTRIMRIDTRKRPAVCAAIGGLLLVIGVFCAQQPAAFSREPDRIGLPWDWSHEHVIFSQTTDPVVLAAIEQDPRFMHQRLQRGLPLPASALARYLEPRNKKAVEPRSLPHNPGILWSALETAVRGNLSMTVHAAEPRSSRTSTLPASHLRSVLTAIIIVGLAFPIALSRQSRWCETLLSVLAIMLFLTITNCGGVGGTTSTGVGPTSTNPEPQTLKGDWGANIGAMSSITLLNANNAPPMYPAKYSFDTSQQPSCTNDFAVFATGAQGTSTGVNPTPSIMAFNQLYSSQGGGSPAGYCGTSGPTVAWAYINVTCATSTTNSSDRILSSPVISSDGTKVAWVTSNGKVQILTIGTTGNNGTSTSTAKCIENAPGGTGTSPNNAVLNSVTLGNPKNNPTTVTLSQLFVDYNSDSAYVGDDDGYLHKITPFFTATGALSDTATASWAALHSYGVGTLIVDKNGFIQKCTGGGLSGVTQPNWSTTWGGTTSDVTVTWTNEGSGGGWPVYVTGVSTHLDNANCPARFLTEFQRTSSSATKKEACITFSILGTLPQSGPAPMG
jgi:hypothetical protein